MSSSGKVHNPVLHRERRTSDCQIQRVEEIRVVISQKTPNFLVLLRRDRHRTSGCQIPVARRKSRFPSAYSARTTITKKMCGIRPQKASGTEAGTCIHCETKQCVEAGTGVLRRGAPRHRSRTRRARKTLPPLLPLPLGHSTRRRSRRTDLGREEVLPGLRELVQVLVLLPLLLLPLLLLSLSLANFLLSALRSCSTSAGDRRAMSRRK